MELAQKRPRTYSIRGGMGLGDSLYLQGVARYFVEKGFSLEVCSKWPEVFSQLDGVHVTSFRRNNIDILAHYSLRKPRTDTNQWQDCCIQAGIKEPWELKLNWQPSSKLITGNRPYVCLSLPRVPMDRKDGIGRSLMPSYAAIQRVIDRLKDRFLIVQIGAGPALHQFQGIDIDMSNKTSVAELLDIGYWASGFIGYVSFIVPLAESFSKPGLFIWSHKGLKDRYPYVRQISPQKILSKETSKWVMDSVSEREIDAAANAFLR